MKSWSVAPIGQNPQNARKILSISIDRYGGEKEACPQRVINLDGNLEDVRVYNLTLEALKFLDRSIKEGEQVEYRVFLKRDDCIVLFERTPAWSVDAKKACRTTRRNA
jgi:hypothetical protein